MAGSLYRVARVRRHEEIEKPEEPAEAAETTERRGRRNRAARKKRDPRPREILVRTKREGEEEIRRTRNEETKQLVDKDCTEELETREN